MQTHRFTMPRASKTPRERLVETAEALFCAEGVHGVGIDRVLATAGVAKATLYKHFRSKDDLVLAALRRLDERGRCDLARAVERAADDPRERFIALADVVARGAGNGCFFVLAAQEFPDGDHPIHAAAREHKRLMRSWLADLAREAGVADPEASSSAALLVVDGLYAASALGPEDRERATTAARTVLERLVAAPG